VATKPQKFPTPAANAWPAETVRDLLGIVRALYALQRSKGNHGPARELADAGKRLRHALELMSETGTAEVQASAWKLADAAIATIARVQSRSHGGDDLTAVVRLASERVKGRWFKLADRDERRQARIKRG
jgi:hypothetical protein